MEKIDKGHSFKNIGGDSDDEIDWEDFIIISGKYMIG